MHKNSKKIQFGDFKIYYSSGLVELPLYIEEYFKQSENQVFIITDDVLYKLYEGEIESIIKKYGYKKYIIKSGENNKNIRTVTDLYDFLIESGANRQSVLVALGGGIVGDLVGYTAATFMRGIKFISVPTTLISQVDSCLGGKVGYNHGKIKNIIGTFYNSEFIYINPGFLKTLPKEQFLSGLGEVIKYGFIKDISIIEFIEDNPHKILNMDEEAVSYLVDKCLDIKAKIVKEDFNDLGVRNILNFGHTFGHAIETQSSYKVFHGNAIALGMLVALKLSVKLLKCPEEVYVRLERLLGVLGIPSKYNIDNYTSILYPIIRDKKNDNFIRFVLLENIGIPKVKIQVEESDIIWAMDESINRREQ